MTSNLSARPKRIIVGISGASGAIYGIELLKALKDLKIETHLVISKTGGMTITEETSYSIDKVQSLADHVHQINNLAASISSGSFKTEGMVIAPCSARSLGEIACGTGDNLLTRAADVVLKERRRLVLLVRETPLSSIHIRNMLTLSDMGAIIAPPLPAFYTHPISIHDMIMHTVGRTLDAFDIEHNLIKRWGE